jgi:hypothetical protein
MTNVDHAQMSRKVRQVLDAHRGKPTHDIAVALAAVVSRDYAIEQTIAAGEHWTETWASGVGVPSTEKENNLDGCAACHKVWYQTYTLLNSKP